MQNSQKYFFQSLFIVCLGIYIFLLYFNPIWGGGDIWRHLSTGRWMAEHLTVPHEGMFPFAHEKTSFWPYNEELGSVIFYMIFKVGGLLGLKVFRAIFGVFVISILFCYSYKRLPFSLLIIFILLASLGLSYVLGLTLRSDLFNYFFVQTFLIILFDYEDSGNSRRLWILPILSLIWFSVHMGSILFGMPLLFIFLLSACIRFFNINLGFSNNAGKLSAKRQIRNLIFTILACLASFMVNPYGWEGFLSPFKFLIANFMGYNHQYFLSLTEIRPPAYIFLSFQYFYFFVLFAFSLLIIFLNRKNNFTLTTLLLTSLFAFLCVQRNSGFFTLVCAYVIAVGAKQIRVNDFWQNLRFLRIVDGLLFIGAIFFLLTQISNIWSQKSYYNGQFINNRSVIVDHLSEDPVKLLISNKINGPVFNDRLGDLMIWLGYPDLKPFYNMYNWSETYNNKTAIMSNPQEFWPKAQKIYNFKIIIMDALDPIELNFIKYLGTQPEWQLISVSGSYVTYVKRGEFHLNKELDSFEALLKSHEVSVNDLQTLKSLINRKTVLMNQEFAHATDIDLYLSTFTFFNLGYKGVAVENLVKALKISNLPDIRNDAVFVLKQLANH